MSPTAVLAILFVLAVVGYFVGRGRALAASGGRLTNLHSVPGYYGLYVAFWCGIPALLLLVLWLFLGPVVIDRVIMGGLPPEVTEGLSAAQQNLLHARIQNLAGGRFQADASDPVLLAAAERLVRLQRIADWAIAVVALAVAIAGMVFARSRIAPKFRARNAVERIMTVFMILCSMIAILTTLGIILSLLFESLRFFARVPVTEFLFGLQWSPQTAIRADQAGSSGAFGAVPVFTGTLLISLIAMLVAVPLGLLSAIYLAEYAPRRVRATVKPLLEILAGVPTVVYGFFAVLTIAPLLREAGASIGLGIDANSALTAGMVMGVMIIPFISSLSDDVINAVPQALRDGSSALGATRSETIRQVVLPAALPGIVGAVMLAISRAIGETMIVVMAAGLFASLTFNPLKAVTAVTVQIVTNLTGDQEFDSAKTLSAFALGLTLFVVTLVLNVIALSVVKKYREKYD
jgi:phosphate transport system permease protein